MEDILIGEVSPGFRERCDPAAKIRQFVHRELTLQGVADERTSALPAPRGGAAQPTLQPRIDSYGDSRRFHVIQSTTSTSIRKSRGRRLEREEAKTTSRRHPEQDRRKDVPGTLGVYDARRSLAGSLALAAIAAVAVPTGAGAQQEATVNLAPGTVPVAGAPIQITFLDVGQADAVLIQTPEGRTALVDAGRRSPVEALREHGVAGIDLLVASHAHADHIGGVTAIMDAFPVRFYLDNGVPYTTATYRWVLGALERRPEITYLTAEPRTITLGGATLEVLPAPPVPPDSVTFTWFRADAVPDTVQGAMPEGASEAAADTVPHAPLWIAGDDQNNRSVALVVRHGSFAAFLSGDSETEQLTHLLREAVVPDVTLLKAPHHGSRNGFTRAYLEVARPEVVVISVGADNPYDHPALEALEAYETIADVYRTDLDGSVTVLGYPDGSYEVITAEGSDDEGR